MSSMIYLTGDIHGDIDLKKLNMRNFPEQKELTRNDVLIILGDFGLNNKSIKKEKHYLDWINSRNYTTLFVDGNHEEFPVLNSYPVVEVFGAKCHQLCDNVYHLMRGEIYHIDGKTFFVMGGAESHSGKLITMEEFKKNRKKYTVLNDNYELASVIGRDWFKEEMPSEEELQYGLNNLKAYDNKVNYILSHSASNRVESCFNRPSPKMMQGWHLCDYFDLLESSIDYDKWFFGHYHRDEKVDEKHQCLYQKIICL